jgi:hypothetical protein
LTEGARRDFEFLSIVDKSYGLDVKGETPRCQAAEKHGTALGKFLLGRLLLPRKERPKTPEGRVGAVNRTTLELDMVESHRVRDS